MNGLNATHRPYGNATYNSGVINMNPRLCFQAHDDYYNCIDNQNEESILSLNQISISLNA
jgi:hypothetical protein